MRLVFSTAEGDVFPLDVELATSWADVQAILEASSGITMHTQRYAHNGKPIQPPVGATIAALGLKDDDMIVVTAPTVLGGARAGTSSSSRPSTAGGRGSGKRRGGGQAGQFTTPKAPEVDSALYTSLTWHSLPPGLRGEDLWKILQVNTQMAKEMERDVDLCAAARKADSGAALRSLLMARQLANALPEAERKAKLAGVEKRLRENPYDVEAQQLLEDEIQRANMEENRDLAYEHMPEAFVRIHMLYIEAVVNGVPVRAFVDSGAQMTIMNPCTATRCGIMRLLDKRAGGTARGVGSAKILGKVHMAPLLIAGQHFPCTFSVMEGDMDFLFGLDMLRRYRACIDLSKGVLRLQMEEATVEVPFLDERESMRIADGEDDAFNRPEEGTGAGATSSAGGAACPGPGASAGGGDVQMADSSSVATLESMGFPRTKVLQALSLAGGDVMRAAALLPDL